MDIEYSDDEAQVEVDAYKTQELPFGKYKGSTFESMIKTPKTRGYLKYLLKWDELQAVTRAHINQALEAYAQSKVDSKPSGSPKKKSSKTSKRKRDSTE